MATNPMSKWETRLARENRRIAQIDLRKAEVEKMEGEEIAIPRAIKYITIGLTSLFISWIVCGYTSGVIKHQQEQTNVTACERFATQAGVEADCGTGKVKGGAAK